MTLFEGERLPTLKSGHGAQPPDSDLAIDQKYIKGEVRIVTEQARYPLSAIVGMLETGDYELNPEFQRRHRWDDERRSRLIESFIMNVPVPPIFLYEDRYSHYEVMDGQRNMFRAAVAEFYEEHYAAFEGRYTNLRNIEDRNRLFGQLVDDVLARGT